MSTEVTANLVIMEMTSIPLDIMIRIGQRADEGNSVVNRAQTRLETVGPPDWASSPVEALQHRKQGGKPARGCSRGKPYRNHSEDRQGDKIAKYKKDDCDSVFERGRRHSDHSGALKSRWSLFGGGLKYRFRPTFCAQHNIGVVLPCKSGCLIG